MNFNAQLHSTAKLQKISGFYYIFTEKNVKKCLFLKKNTCSDVFFAKKLV